MSLSKFRDYYAISAYDSADNLIGIRIVEEAYGIREVLAEMLTAFPMAQVSVAKANFSNDTVIAYANYNSVEYQDAPGDFNILLMT